MKISFIREIVAMKQVTPLSKRGSRKENHFKKRHPLTLVSHQRE